MERFHRYYSLHRILSSRRLPVPRAAIERELECSRATVNRIIDVYSERAGMNRLCSGSSATCRPAVWKRARSRCKIHFDPARSLSDLAPTNS